MQMPRETLLMSGLIFVSAGIILGAVCALVDFDLDHLTWLIAMAMTSSTCMTFGVVVICAWWVRRVVERAEIKKDGE